MFEYQKTLLMIARGIEDKSLMLDLHQLVGRRQEKSLSVIAFCKFALSRHPTVIVATNDQANTLEKLREYFPQNLIDTVDGGLRIHRMKE